MAIGTSPWFVPFNVQKQAKTAEFIGNGTELFQAARFHEGLRDRVNENIAFLKSKEDDELQCAKDLELVLKELSC